MVEDSQDWSCKEPPKEKSYYDVEVSMFDPSFKIALIKEIIALFGLVLKEVKELLESAPGQERTLKRRCREKVGNT